MGVDGGCIQVHTGNLRIKNQLEDPGGDGRVILKWVFKKDGAWTGLLWLRIGTDGGLF
jgi:hypothetical protein